jgi:hypothetical protein
LPGNQTFSGVQAMQVNGRVWPKTERRLSSAQEPQTDVVSEGDECRDEQFS